MQVIASKFSPDMSHLNHIIHCAISISVAGTRTLHISFLAWLSGSYSRSSLPSVLLLLLGAIPEEPHFWVLGEQEVAILHYHLHFQILSTVVPLLVSGPITALVDLCYKVVHGHYTGLVSGLFLWKNWPDHCLRVVNSSHWCIVFTLGYLNQCCLNSLCIPGTYGSQPAQYGCLPFA